MRLVDSPAMLLTNCKMSGLRVTMPDPRGRKSLCKKQTEVGGKKQRGTGSKEDQKRVNQKKKELLDRFGCVSGERRGEGGGHRARQQRKRKGEKQKKEH